MKQLITAQDIQNARKAGQSALSVPKGALVTPQARDDARHYGIALLEPSESRTASQASFLPPPAAAPAPIPMPASAPADNADLITRQVAAKLGGDADLARIKAVLEEVLAERSGQEAGGAVLVRRPAPGSSVADAVTLTDSLPPDEQGPGVGYLELRGTAIDWTFTDAEALLVLEGELRVTGASGLDLRAGPGEALRVSAGLRCRLSATGHVVCLYSAWPK